MATTPATTSPSVQLTLPAKQELDSIQAIIAECGLSCGGDEHHVIRAMKRSAGIQALRTLLTDKFMTTYVMPLQGSRLGFRTDKDKEGGYKLPVVRECVIECLLQGGNIDGNEFNIIAGNTYFTKEFFERAVGELAGLADLELKAGVPVMKNGGALVPYAAYWKLNGVQKSILCLEAKIADGLDFDDRIAVKVNEKMGMDAILGKAKRKMLARVYNQVTGSNVWEGDPDDTVITTSSSAPTSLGALTSKLTNQAADKTSSAPSSDQGDDGPTRTNDESQEEQKPGEAEQSQEAEPQQPNTEELWLQYDARLDEATTLIGINNAEKWARSQGLDETQIRAMGDQRRNELKK